MEEPNLIEKAKNLTTAMGNWAVNDGFKKVSENVYVERKSICEGCEHWDPTGYNNMGKCKICGCSVGKLYIPSSRCPLNPPKWSPISV